MSLLLEAASCTRASLTSAEETATVPSYPALRQKFASERASAVAATETDLLQYARGIKQANQAKGDSAGWFVSGNVVITLHQEVDAIMAAGAAEAGGAMRD
jgi:hypothetical protein